MVRSPELLEATCPRCGEEYADWEQPIRNRAAELVCPRCGFRPAQDLRIRDDGFWECRGFWEYRATDEGMALQ